MQMLFESHLCILFLVSAKATELCLV